VIIQLTLQTVERETGSAIQYCPRDMNPSPNNTKKHLSSTTQALTRTTRQPRNLTKNRVFRWDQSTKEASGEEVKTDVDSGPRISVGIDLNAKEDDGQATSSPDENLPESGSTSIHLIESRQHLLSAGIRVLEQKRIAGLHATLPVVLPELPQPPVTEGSDSEENARPQSDASEREDREDDENQELGEETDNPYMRPILEQDADRRAARASAAERNRLGIGCQCVGRYFP
jgi:hypothetical protein